MSELVERLDELIARKQAHVDYVTKEMADPEGSWFDTYDGLERDKAELETLRAAREAAAALSRYEQAETALATRFATMDTEAAPPGERLARYVEAINERLEDSAAALSRAEARIAELERDVEAADGERREAGYEF